MKKPKWITRLVLLGMMISTVVPHVAAPASDDGTLTVGRTAVSLPCPFNEGEGALFGYLSGKFGAYSSAALTGGRTAYGVQELGCTGHPAGVSELEVTGFSSDPGYKWLTSITCNGVRRTWETCSYKYSNGSASWQWSGNFGLWKMTDGTSVNCTIVTSE